MGKGFPVKVHEGCNVVFCGDVYMYIWYKQLLHVCMYRVSSAEICLLS